MHTPAHLFLRGVLVPAAHLLFAGIAAAQAPLAANGELILAEDFQRHAVYTKERLPLADGWTVRVAHGSWERTAEGVKSTWASGHSPVLVIEGMFGDAVIEVDFRYTEQPGRWAACRVSATNPQLYPRAYAASVWANVSFKSRGRGFLVENDEWDGHITRVAYKKAEFAPAQWHTLRFTLLGQKAQAECAGIRATGTHERFAMAKTSVWLGTGQSEHELRRLRIYRARPGEGTVEAKETEP
jgi:hypothetical protein